MFDIIQPDSFALGHAEEINNIGNQIKNYLTDSVKRGLWRIFYENRSSDVEPLVLRPVADVQRILNAFVRPSEVLTRHSATVAYLLSKYPDCLAPEDYTPPYTLTVDEATGAITVSE
jgi:hypothetical protein